MLLDRVEPRDPSRSVRVEARPEGGAELREPRITDGTHGVDSQHCGDALREGRGCVQRGCPPPRVADQHGAVPRQLVEHQAYVGHVLGKRERTGPEDGARPRCW